MISKTTRRHFLAASASAISCHSVAQAQEKEKTSSSPGNLRLASFRFDITPPKGHSLCGGWIKPVIDIDDPLEAIGYVLLGAGNAAGGYVVTERMLEMFKPSDKKK